MSQPSSASETVASFRDLDLEFEPGAEMRYSNSGYVLLGHMIEVVTGTSYEEFVRSNIFEALGMEDSGYDSNSQIISNRAAGYSPGPGGPVNARFMHMSGPHAAGGLYSTSVDLMKWNRGLFGKELLSEASFDRMVTPYLNDYAFGVIVMEDSGRTVIQHAGGVPGFNTTLRYYPGSEITVVAMANINGNAPGEIAASLGAYVHGEEVVLTSERQEIEVDADVLADYVGIYRLSPQARMTITLEAGQLVSQVSGQGKAPIFPESETRFFVRIVDAQIDFARDSTGAVSHLVLHQGGRDVTAPRTSTEVGVRTEIELAADVLAQYVGVYELGSGFDPYSPGRRWAGDGSGDRPGGLSDLCRGRRPIFRPRGRHPRSNSSVTREGKRRAWSCSKDPSEPRRRESKYAHPAAALCGHWSGVRR